MIYDYAQHFSKINNAICIKLGIYLHFKSKNNLYFKFSTIIAFLKLAIFHNFLINAYFYFNDAVLTYRNKMLICRSLPLCLVNCCYYAISIPKLGKFIFLHNLRYLSWYIPNININSLKNFDIKLLIPSGPHLILSSLYKARIVSFMNFSIHLI